MKSSWLPPALFAAGMLLSLSAAKAQQPGITVGQGWTRTTNARHATAQGFFTIRNRGNTPDRLVSAACPVARHTVIAGANGRPLSGIPIRPGQVMALKPGGIHLLLRDTHFRLYSQATIPCSAVFENAGAMILYLHVEPAGAKAYRRH